jgi:hypothetical protein
MSLQRLCITVGIAVVIGAHLARADPPEEPTLASMNLSCSDFKQNQNGSWSPLHTVQITRAHGTGVKMGPSTSFDDRAVFGGVRLAQVLQRECLRQ